MKNLAPFFVLLFIVSSCKEKSNYKYLPESIGQVQSILVVMEEDLWESAVGDSVRKAFTSPIKGLAVAEPALDPIQLTRFLITAEATGQPVLLVFSKADLLPELAVSQWSERAAAWGYGALPVSCRDGRGLEALRERLSQPGLAALAMGFSDVVLAINSIRLNYKKVV